MKNIRIPKASRTKWRMVDMKSILWISQRSYDEAEKIEAKVWKEFLKSKKMRKGMGMGVFATAANSLGVTYRCIHNIPTDVYDRVYRTLFNCTSDTMDMIFYIDKEGNIWKG